ncbi:glycoside hydrolase family 172 protein [Martelella mediterranea]|uniref:DUF2961 family protein n=1 Tax=Martelella mediterranea TaxID=293089 RepID=A0A4V2V3I8_9HYPH|nr:glycoside hydrolase family 172 protein [Martelella mediterranea]TCT33064.1 DUF2961 family protein [Martelella mediterranea]
MSIGNLNDIFRPAEGRSRAITAENPTGAKGAGGKAAGPLGVARKGRAFLPLPAGAELTLCDIRTPGIITHIWCTTFDQTEKHWFALRNIVLRMYWDDEETPSVEAPLGDFFCNGFGERAIVNSLPVVVNPTGGMNCYFPMPFRKSGRITVTSEHPEDIEAFFYQIDYTEKDSLPEDTEYFHAAFRRENPTAPGQDFVIVDNIRGRGKYVGTFLAWTSLERFWYGEGEVKFYIDGDWEWPTICGTGAEDYFGGAWGFVTPNNGAAVAEQTYSTPFMGFPQFVTRDKVRAHIYDGAALPMRGFYRWHLPDPILFESDLKVTVQQIGHDGLRLFERSDDLCAVAYWYQREPHAAFKPLPDAAGRRPR